MHLNNSPQLTIFSIPKSFSGPAAIAQHNAINSWRHLSPLVKVMLIGDDPGVAQAAGALGIQHVAGVKTNGRGTPLLSSAFELAHQRCDTPLLAYCNSDVILLPEFVAAIQRLMADPTLPEFMAIGRRTNLQVDRLIDFGNRDAVRWLIDQCRTRGKLESIVCKEFFVFPSTRFKTIPDFAVGRGNWDNWMVHEAKRLRIPVVSVSQCVLAIHQNHDYSHLNSSRLSGYVLGQEARENQRLAGGRHLIRGSTAQWRLGQGGLKPMSTNKWGLEFWSDFPRFVRLMADLTKRR